MIPHAFKNPGFYVLLMGWWIVAFFVRELMAHPIGHYFSSYIPFFVVFLLLWVASMIVRLPKVRGQFWEGAGHWIRFSVVFGAYAASIILALIVTILLDYWRMVAYFGGDAGGSFGLLYIPSIIIYLIVGIIFCAASSLVAWRRKGFKGTTER